MPILAQVLSERKSSLLKVDIAGCPLHSEGWYSQAPQSPQVVQNRVPEVTKGINAPEDYQVSMPPSLMELEIRTFMTLLGRLRRCPKDQACLIFCTNWGDWDDQNERNFDDTSLNHLTGSLIVHITHIFYDGANIYGTILQSSMVR